MKINTEHEVFCVVMIFVIVMLTITAINAGTLTWTAPTQREDGTALQPAEIAGYRIYYGPAAGDYTADIQTNSNATTYNATGLIADGYHAVITAMDTDGRESLFSGDVTVPTETVLKPSSITGLTVARVSGLNYSVTWAIPVPPAGMTISKCPMYIDTVFFRDMPCDKPGTVFFTATPGKHVIGVAVDAVITETGEHTISDVASVNMDTMLPPKPPTQFEYTPTPGYTTVITITEQPAP